MPDKNGFPHFMLKEIFEQPRAAEDTMLGRVSVETGKVFLEELGISEHDLRNINKVSIIACGTSWHAALVGKFLIERFAHLFRRRKFARAEDQSRVELVAGNRQWTFGQRHRTAE